MLRAFGLIFISLLLASFVSIISQSLGGTFILDYAKNNSIEVLATIYALNIATATFLIGSLLNVEERAQQTVFDTARREIKHNIFVMTFLFVLNLFVVASIGNETTLLPFTTIGLNQALATVVIAILFFYTYLLLEILSGSLKLKAPLDSDK